MVRGSRFGVRVGFLVLIAAAVSAQPAARRPTNIAALKSFGSFYHNRPILLVGTVATDDKGVRVSDDNGSFRVLYKGSAPDGLDEIRGEFWDLGRMKPDEPQLTSYDLQKTFGVDPNGPWPRPGEVTAIIATNISQAVLPPAATIRTLTLFPTRFVDQKVTVTGQFSGRNLFGDLPDSPGKSKWDFVLRASDSAIWITGAQPKGKGFNFSLDSRLDSGRWLEITGTVKTARGLVWLDVKEDDIKLGKAPTDTAPAEVEQVARIAPAPRPEVVFSAPTQEEIDVPIATTVRIQFSRDINASTLKGHITVTPPVDFTTSYTGANRSLEIKFAKPFQRFGKVRVELSDGILGTDKQPLQPYTLTFDLGGV